MTHLLLFIIYIAYISLGLPDALLGSAWPSIYPEFSVPVSYAGMISMVIALGTTISSLQSDRLTVRFGTGTVTAVSVGMTAIALVLSLPLWKFHRKKEETEPSEKIRKAMGFMEILSVRGAKAVMVSFFCYCAIEQTVGLWAASYLTLQKGLLAEQAASFASMFYLGITIGRAFSGFLTMRWNDRQMVRIGQEIIALGCFVLLFPFSSGFSVAGFIFIGLGCAPIYPCMIHATPEQFGAERSQALIGVEMASACVGTCLMPPLFGVIANSISIGLLPWYLLVILFLMMVMFEKLNGGHR